VTAADPKDTYCGQPECPIILGSRCLVLQVAVGCDGGLRKWHLGVFKEFPKREHLRAAPLHMQNIIPDLGIGG